jgi:hypothetical protein
MALRKTAAAVATSTLLGIALLPAIPETALAYGRADQPVAQVEISANCDNPSFGLCQEVGLGGVWVWSELDSDTGSGTVADPSPMDSTVTFCSHQTPGVPNGAFGHPDRDGVWYRISSLAEMPPGASPFFDTSVSYSSYYVMDFFPGTGQDDFIAVVPAPVGHYSLKPAHAVSIETQVAP